jgi:transposase
MENARNFDAWLKIFNVLNESQKRWFAAQKASEIGYGGIQHVSARTGLSRTTITRGLKELRRDQPLLPERVRKPGGGRKQTRQTHETVVQAIEQIVDETTAGDPMSSLKWTCKSTRNIADELSVQGVSISYRTVGRILKDLEYSLQANRKVIPGSTPADRDEQFHYLNGLVKQFMTAGNPVISVDTKKKELVGNFKNHGRTWRKKGQARAVYDHDFYSLAEGTAIPYGAYDLTRNEGFVNVGMTADTAEFAVSSIAQWWELLGQKWYPAAQELLICADGGGSNGSRNRAWKYHLHHLATRTRLTITVCHYPPGTSKWNKIEHRMFSFISLNWKGKPLESYETVVQLIGGTHNRKGLKIEARLDTHDYKKGVKISDDAFHQIQIRFHEKYPKWNYTITPKC